MKDAAAVAAPLEAAIQAQDVAADALIGKHSDALWNVAGRPANDPALSVVFPGGIAYYAAEYGEEQVVRMELLAELLETLALPKIPQDVAHEAAVAIRDAANTYGAAVEAARKPVARRTFPCRACH